MAGVADGGEVGKDEGSFLTASNLMLRRQNTGALVAPVFFAFTLQDAPRARNGRNSHVIAVRFLWGRSGAL